MRAMVLEKLGQSLVEKVIPMPVPNSCQVLIKITACGVCRTDLHILDGELTPPKLPLILGHEIIGTVVARGTEVKEIKEGETVGVPWLGYTCGQCKYCLHNQENLCEFAGFTGYTLDGGYAEYTVANERYCFPLAAATGPAAAPLLCAGLIGYRSYKMAGPHLATLGIYGFGAAAHILIQLAISQNIKVFAFTRPGDKASQQFALKLGATWAGDSMELPPEKLDAAILFAPAGPLVPLALKALDKGGKVVCGGIHMSDIPTFPYHLLWEERILRSVANLTRQDGLEFLELAPQVPIKTETQLFPLAKANEALEALRQGKVNGAAVLLVDFP
ncbi:zinc-dependent alcohol dehydrogenase family protein [Adhaeribacter rhizoryzae]|uniref:Zinc-dependent alcohol dehydrogenase family protein n=2 Tax=Adhaeribacter rhizoryzae TaxID=2607907 RepID=A0A5M6CZY7_9BACT|nr:zinc-dependent alcohol dehydrogenase family protein [Adhaeribacter rhizoryzae]